mmetsp:Transcript_14528/g.29731  ORF Transcript_14528/g.29731 Transcript_14528/m.29731 type:complete len:85 (+) Transcript_14528:1867-2121(+)
MDETKEPTTNGRHDTTTSIVAKQHGSIELIRGGECIEVKYISQDHALLCQGQCQCMWRSGGMSCYLQFVASNRAPHCTELNCTV